MTLRRGIGAVALAALGASCSDAHITLLEPAETPYLPDAGDPESREEAGAPAPAPDLDALRRTACERFISTGEREQALLMAVLDVSNSMAAPFGAGGTRWDAERPIFADAISTLPWSIGLGVLYYPNMATAPSLQPRSISACVNTQALIPVNLLGGADSRHRGRILRSLASVQPNPQGGTPTLDAYLVGLSALGSTTLVGSRQMLLVTDGHPTFSEGCVGTGESDDPVDPGPVISVIDAARRAGVRTYVIGSPGSDAPSFSGEDSRGWLSVAAEAGGTSRGNCSHGGPRYCHFDLANEADLAPGLRGALSEIEERMMRCEFYFTDGDLLSRYALNVVLTTEDGRQRLLPTASSDRCADGWYYGDDKARVALCEDTCATLRSQSQARIEFLFFGCTQAGRP